MQRHSSFLTLALASSLVTPLTTIVAQTASPSAPQVEVVYLLDHNEVVTYDVDPLTGIPTRQGTLAVLPFSPIIITSVDDHFLYVTGTDKGVWHLWAYAIDPTGSPHDPPIQTLTFKSGTWNFIPNPNGTFAYAAQLVRNSQGQNVVGIRYFSIDASNGRLSESPKVLAVYSLDGPCLPGTGGGFDLLGFSPDGNQLNEAWYCTSYDTNTQYYYTRRVNQQTGALGPDVQTIVTGGTTVAYNLVTITPQAIFDYYNLGFSGSTNILYVYPPRGGANPIFHCTFDMLAACSRATNPTVDPSGNYIFFYTPNGTGIAKVELAGKQIVETGNSIPAGRDVMAFSPDERIIYTRNGSNPYLVGTYIFDLATGAVNPGGEISVPGSSPPSIVPALRK
jgi:hypothetical protein